jgi:hypothetical protein
MASIVGRSAEPAVNWMVIAPLPTVMGNVLSSALKAPLAAATISKFESTGVPLIETLKILFPVVE